MGGTAKVSVTLGQVELRWARARARREGKSLSAIVTETLAAQRRLEALADVVEWMQEDQPPLTKAERQAADRLITSRRR